MDDPNTGSIIGCPGTGKLPLHLHPNATLVNAPLSDPMTSSIFRVSHEKFITLSGREIQAIFRDRHILVYNVPHGQKWRWDKASMEELCPTHIPVQLQGAYSHSRSCISLADCVSRYES